METTLTMVCRAIRNWFYAPDIGNGVSVQTGTYTIENEFITPFAAVLSGAYVRIIGSVLNDGIYLVGHDSRLEGAADETFNGTVALLAIPRDFLEIVEDINHFVEVNKKDKKAGRFTSENIGGYSYTRATSAGGVPASWHEVFQTRLNPYRKMYEGRTA
jgi:hypothetical protein